jgi:hypothetical protein
MKAPLPSFLFGLAMIAAFLMPPGIVSKQSVGRK